MAEEKEGLFELRKQLQALEWDIKYNKLPQGRALYYNKLLKRYNELNGNESQEFKPFEINPEK
ncbi:MAG: hypothetical protein U9Q69_03600 [Nanoarchaeota archaeon]|nr:hypothetical protein [Nanoarchaeota archaeon]